MRIIVAEILIIALISAGIVVFFSAKDFLGPDEPAEKPEEFFVEQQEEKTEEEEISKEKLLEKIGQMLIVGFRGTEIDEQSGIVSVLRDVNPGGVILFDYDNPLKSFPRNILGPKQVEQLIFDLQKYAQTPLFVAVDAEGGNVNRLKSRYGFPEFPGAQEMRRLDDPDKTEKISKELAQNLINLGFNVNFAPVVDVNVNPDNPIIGALGRSFCFDSQEVARQAMAFIKGHSSAGIITAIKHFPGHGSSLEDSHLGMVDVTGHYQDQELFPFQEIIRQGEAEMVMTAHIVNKNIDPVFPVTLSPIFLSDILRKELGFEGVIVSDDMHMGAIIEHYSFEEAIIKAVQAGADLLLISNNVGFYDADAAYKARDTLLKAVQTGEISIQRINESYQRIIELKRSYNLEL